MFTLFMNCLAKKGQIYYQIASAQTLILHKKLFRQDLLKTPQ